MIFLFTYFFAAIGGISKGPILSSIYYILFFFGFNNSKAIVIRYKNMCVEVYPLTSNKGDFYTKFRFTVI